MDDLLDDVSGCLPGGSAVAPQMGRHDDRRAHRRSRVLADLRQIRRGLQPAGAPEADAGQLPEGEAKTRYGMDRRSLGTARSRPTLCHRHEHLRGGQSERGRRLRALHSGVDHSSGAGRRQQGVDADPDSHCRRQGRRRTELHRGHRLQLSLAVCHARRQDQHHRVRHLAGTLSINGISSPPPCR